MVPRCEFRSNGLFLVPHKPINNSQIFFLHVLLAEYLDHLLKGFFVFSDKHDTRGLFIKPMNKLSGKSLRFTDNPCRLIVGGQDIVFP